MRHNLLGPLTPRYWRLRKYRSCVAAQIRKLLPTPYDVSGIELALRFQAFQGLDHSTNVIDAEWEPIVSKLDERVLEKRLAFYRVAAPLRDVLNMLVAHR
jgi:hypothetical protein